MCFTENIDLKSFNDEVVSITDWTPLHKLGCANFRTKELESVRGIKLAIRASVPIKIFTFIWFGGWLTFWFLFEFELALLACLLGVFMFYKYFRPQTFEYSAGYTHRWPWESAPRDIMLNEMHAIQLVYSGLNSGQRSYPTFELNLISKEGSRNAVLAQSDLVHLEDISEQLSNFLNVPIWNAARQQIRSK